MRIIRTCKEMGIRTVAVYSTADRDAAARAAGARVRLHRRPAAGGQLSQHECDPDPGSLRRRMWRHPSRLRLPERKPAVCRQHLAQQCGLTFIGPKPGRHRRSSATRPMARQYDAGGRSAGRARQQADRRHASRKHGQLAEHDHLSAHHQGGQRRRWQRHAHRAQRGGARACVPQRQRARPRPASDDEDVYMEKVHRASQARRGPGAGR